MTNFRTLEIAKLASNVSAIIGSDLLDEVDKDRLAAIRRKLQIEKAKAFIEKAIEFFESSVDLDKFAYAALSGATYRSVITIHEDGNFATLTVKVGTTIDLHISCRHVPEFTVELVDEGIRNSDARKEAMEMFNDLKDTFLLGSK